MKIKKELYIFLVSVFFTIIYELYYASNNFRESVWDAFLRNFLDVENLLVGLIFIAIGYVLFRIIFFIAALFLREKEFTFRLKAVSLTVFICLTLYIINDQLILKYVRDHKNIHYYEPVGMQEIKIDSMNFNKYTWEQKGWDSAYLVDETLKFEEDSSFTLIGESIKCDRLFFIRKLFGIYDEYKINGKWKYGNETFPQLDSGEYPHSIQIREGKLHLDTYF